ncbi:hypothetical protein AB2L28_05860 [Kineococcus sp. TBRC 1896]|uniref:Uncharacterized protein n=1 Tax=Kineococcus mangrovi TaxID=1660183 RepID=A0ABV4HZT8_9ACTN
MEAAIDWCLEHLGDGETLTVWTHLKSNLANNTALDQLVARYSNVQHVTRRGGVGLRRRGPVLMAWADMDDIADLLRFGSHHVTALAVLSWDDEAVRPWAAAAKPVVLGNPSSWTDLVVELDPVVVEALDDLTGFINHNNTISGGHEKEHVVSTLFALYDAGFQLAPKAMQGWVLAHGWAGDNPLQLATDAKDIGRGRRPRARQVLRADYIEQLRRQVEDRDPRP